MSRTFQLGEIVAERDYELRDADGHVSPVRLRIGKPEPDEGGRPWICPRQIVGLGDEKVRPGYAVDSIEALLTTLKLAEVELLVFARDANKTILWLGHTDLGLTTSSYYR